MVAHSTLTYHKHSFQAMYFGYGLLRINKSLLAIDQWCDCLQALMKLMEDISFIYLELT